MNKVKILGVIAIIILIIIVVLTINHKKENYDLEVSEEINGKILSVSSDGLTIQDDENLIYTFKDFKDDGNLTVGDSFVFNYKGTLNKNTCEQTASILKVAKMDVADEDSLFDNGMFKDFYKMAYNTLSKMTLDEKIGQVILAGAPATHQIETLQKNNYSGYILYKRDFDGKTANEVIKHINSLQKSSKIPLLIAVDEEGGSVIRVSSNSKLVSEPFKSSQELYNEGGLSLIKTDTINKSKILNNLGINVNLAPVVDVTDDKDAYIYKRTLGQNTEVTSEYAKTVISASKGTGVSYTLKHFPGYGNNKDTHDGISTDNRTYEELVKNDLPPFISGVKAGAEAVLVGHNIISSVDSKNPATLSASVHNLLTNEVGFTGISITDDLSMAAITDSDALVKALMAGNDLLIVTDSESSVNKILKAVNEGTLSEKVVDKAALRVLAWKYYKGLFLDNQK